MKKIRTKYKIDWHNYSVMCDNLDEATDVAKTIRDGKEKHVAFKTKPTIMKITLEEVDYEN